MPDCHSRCTSDGPAGNGSLVVRCRRALLLAWFRRPHAPHHLRLPCLANRFFVVVNRWRSCTPWTRTHWIRSGGCWARAHRRQRHTAVEQRLCTACRPALQAGSWAWEWPPITLDPLFSLLFVPSNRPIYGLIFLFKWQKEEDSRPVEANPEEAGVFFASQVRAGCERLRASHHVCCMGGWRWRPDDAATPAPRAAHPACARCTGRPAPPRPFTPGDPQCLRHPGNRVGAAQQARARDWAR